MIKTLYDTDCITWSPVGKLFQVPQSLFTFFPKNKIRNFKKNSNFI